MNQNDIVYVCLLRRETNIKENRWTNTNKTYMIINKEKTIIRNEHK